MKCPSLPRDVPYLPTQILSMPSREAFQSVQYATACAKVLLRISITQSLTANLLIATLNDRWCFQKYGCKGISREAIKNQILT